MNIELSQDEAARITEAVRWHRPEYETQLARLEKSKTGVRVELKAIRKQKTPEQVGYYWAVIEGAAEHLGDSSDGLHSDLMFESGFFEIRETKRGSKARRISSNDLTIDQYIKLINTLERVSAMAGYTLPPPRKRNERTTND